MSPPADVLVLSKGTHGEPVEAYGAKLRERLPDHDVAVATTPSEERELIEGVPYVTGRAIDEELLELADAMELFACGYAGTDHLPMDALRAAGVTVTNASGVHGPNMAEQVIGAILAAVRRFEAGQRRQSRNEWRHYQTHELMGDTVTIVGLGAIGTAIADRLDGFGVDTIGIRYSPEKGGPTDEVLGFDDEAAFEEALARTDQLVLACPLTETTEGLIGRDELGTLPPSAYVVNVARGPVLDTDALLWALRSNRLRGAHLDVTDPEPLPNDHPLWDLETVRITPHNAGYTPKYYDRLADILAGNVRRSEAGEELENVVP
ncbi:D-isomer specific 2-hydroxyacid dehydrogenase NAD-binding protein [Salinarchaeum sp. Harcht-Bsk1]|uniref:NAD(P)-dependent oxidoreductase n=1 Tax=Salinarchaeum sp. Harcht-Bsk1 TaxID=1333523 RepID=UPI00034236EC|nr:D-2-hydroxyacid dehydrogenase [Salinarchaeum sp. Harcht-Bsk1]AGN02028.1 D-isomer specific 2-hydroxyacid dehydrogenase NAD-binding protein [Salinarchaeum sp. Harcht-Bsk1]